MNHGGDNLPELVPFSPSSPVEHTATAYLRFNDAYVADLPYLGRRLRRKDHRWSRRSCSSSWRAICSTKGTPGPFLVQRSTPHLSSPGTHDITVDILAKSPPPHLHPNVGFRVLIKSSKAPPLVERHRCTIRSNGRHRSSCVWLMYTRTPNNINGVTSNTA